MGTSPTPSNQKPSITLPQPIPKVQPSTQPQPQPSAQPQHQPARKQKVPLSQQQLQQFHMSKANIFLPQLSSDLTPPKITNKLLEEKNSPCQRIVGNIHFLRHCSAKKQKQDLSLSVPRTTSIVQQPIEPFQKVQLCVRKRLLQSKLGKRQIITPSKHKRTDLLKRLDICSHIHQTTNTKKDHCKKLAHLFNPVLQSQSLNVPEQDYQQAYPQPQSHRQPFYYKLSKDRSITQPNTFDHHHENRFFNASIGQTSDDIVSLSEQWDQVTNSPDHLLKLVKKLPINPRHRTFDCMAELSAALVSSNAFFEQIGPHCTKWIIKGCKFITQGPRSIVMAKGRSFLGVIIVLSGTVQLNTKGYRDILHPGQTSCQQSIFCNTKMWKMPYSLISQSQSVVSVVDMSCLERMKSELCLARRTKEFSTMMSILKRRAIMKRGKLWI